MEIYPYMKEAIVKETIASFIGLMIFGIHIEFYRQ